MSTATLDPVDAIEQQTVERKKNAAAAFWRLAQTLARKKKVPPPSEAAEILEDAGKSPADLREAVATVDKRLALAAQISAAAGLAPERAILIAKHDKGLAVFNDAVATFEAVRNSTLPELAQIEQAEIAAEQARATLAKTCPYPANEALAEVREKIVLIGVRRGQLERMLESHRREQLDIANTPPPKYGNLADGMNRGPAPHKPERVAELKAEIDSAGKELLTIRAALDPLAKEESRLIALTLEP